MDQPDDVKINAATDGNEKAVPERGDSSEAASLTPAETDAIEILLDLEQALQDASTPPPRPGEVEITVSADKLQAFMIVRAPEVGGAPADMTQVLHELETASIRYGIDEAAIAGALEAGARPTRAKPRPVLIAQGDPPVKGQDAVITYGDALNQVGGVPVKRDDGTVDFFNLNIVRNVTPDTLLATRTPPTPGTPGTDVTGEPIPAPAGTDIRLKVGPGTVLREDELQVFADAEGHAVVDEREMRFSVLPVFEVRTDVGPETGSIDFWGTVIVKGSILGGYFVKATQDLEVHGGIDGGSAEIGGHISVRYGIQGAGRGTVVAGGHVTCRFMENAHVQAKGDITVTDGILHSVVMAGGKIHAPGRKGLIVGGQVRAKEQIVARVVGSSLATPTEVEVGTDPDYKDKMQALVRGLRETEETIKKTYQVINLLKDIETNRPAEFTLVRRETLVKALHSLRRLVEQQAELKAQKAALEADSQLSVSGTIKISDVVFPGVRVTICNSTYLVDDTMRGGNFYFSSEEGNVKVG